MKTSFLKISSVFILYSKLIFAQEFTQETSHDPDWVSSTVRVCSGFCPGPGKSNQNLCDGKGSLRGSGTLLRVGENTYVITSEHVVLQGSSYCHSVQSEKLGEWKVSWKAGGVHSGIAVLEVLERDKKVSLPSIPELKHWNIALQERSNAGIFSFLGFKWNGDFLEESRQSNFQIANRKEISHVKKMIQFSNGYGTYGMSGGVVTEDGKVLGLLSHLYVVEEPGRGEVVKKFKSERLETNHVLAIPAATIYTKVREFLTSDLNQEVLRTLDGDFSVDGLKATEFSNSNPNARNLLPGGDPGGIGGGGMDACTVSIKIRFKFKFGVGDPMAVSVGKFFRVERDCKKICE